jgi:preprotein translocase subunit YajC
MSFFISDALAAASPAMASPNGGLSSILLMVGFILIFYFMLWRPQAKRAKEQRNLLNSLAKGDEVVTSGGLLGKITKMSDDIVELMIAEGIEIKVQKPAIVALLPKGTLKN